MGAFLHDRQNPAGSFLLLRLVFNRVSVHPAEKYGTTEATADINEYNFCKTAVMKVKTGN